MDELLYVRLYLADIPTRLWWQLLHALSLLVSHLTMYMPTNRTSDQTVLEYKHYDASHVELGIVMFFLRNCWLTAMTYVFIPTVVRSRYISLGRSCNRRMGGSYPSWQQIHTQKLFETPFTTEKVKTHRHEFGPLGKGQQFIYHPVNVKS
jgi:hypothetical protein